MRNAAENRGWGARCGMAAGLLVVPLVLGLLWEVSASRVQPSLHRSGVEALAFDPFCLTTDQGALSALSNSAGTEPPPGLPSGGAALGAESRTLTVATLLRINPRPPKRTPILPPWP